MDLGSSFELLKQKGRELLDWSSSFCGWSTSSAEKSLTQRREYPSFKQPSKSAPPLRFHQKRQKPTYTHYEDNSEAMAIDQIGNSNSLLRGQPCYTNGGLWGKPGAEKRPFSLQQSESERMENMEVKKSLDEVDKRNFRFKKNVRTALQQDVHRSMKYLKEERGDQLAHREEKRRKMEAELFREIAEYEQIEFADSQEHGFDKNLVPLDEEQEFLVDDLFAGDDDYIIAELDNIPVTTAHIQCLLPLQWINDEVINFTVTAFENRCRDSLSDPDFPDEEKCSCIFHNTFFYNKLSDNGRGYNYKNVRRWSKKRLKGTGIPNIFCLDKVFLPVHVGQNHWCLACINIKEKRIEYYDSLGGTNYAVFRNLRQYLMDEHVDKLKQEMTDIDQWSDYLPECPKQNNGSDCGVFTCMFANYLSENRQLTFNCDDMPHFRRKMVLDISRRHVE